MKTLKSLTLFTALVILSACSASGNDGKNNGGTGGNEGGDDAFLTAISKYSKMTGQLGGGNVEVTISSGGKIFTVMDIQDPTAPEEIPGFNYVRSLSSTKAEYSQENFTPDSATIIEISGTDVKITDSYYGQGTVTLTLVE